MLVVGDICDDGLGGICGGCKGFGRVGGWWN